MMSIPVSSPARLPTIPAISIPSRAEQAAEASAIFQAACPNAELSVLSGGQPVYYYMISVE